jgi:hypothetical protein
VALGLTVLVLTFVVVIVFVTVGEGATVGVGPIDPDGVTVRVPVVQTVPDPVPV